MRLICSTHRFVGGVLPLLFAAGCSTSPSSPATPNEPAAPNEPASQVIGTAGGNIASSDGVLSLSIPAGAVDGDVMVTISPQSSPPAGAIGVAYDIGPTGTVFHSPVTLTFHYALASLGNASPANLHVATYASNAWQVLDGDSVDMTAQTVAGTTLHLSPYGVVGESCTAVELTSTCSSGGASGPAGSGEGPAPACPTAASCATATGICADFPGAQVTGCVDGAAGGYTASCCFAPGTAVCFTQKASGGCAAGESSCASLPRCENASPCSQIAGSTAQSCADSSDGYTATCCFPIGVIPGAPAGSSGSADGGALAGDPTRDGGASADGGSGVGIGPSDAAPPVQPNAGVPQRPDAGSSSPPPDASTCQYKVDPVNNGTCAVKGACSGSATSYQMDCTVPDSGSGAASCTCKQDDVLTGNTTQDCATISAASIVQCKYPAP
jgi:hypothetical protein